MFKNNLINFYYCKNKQAYFTVKREKKFNKGTILQVVQNTLKTQLLTFFNLNRSLKIF